MQNSELPTLLPLPFAADGGGGYPYDATFATDPNVGINLSIFDRFAMLLQNKTRG